MKPKLFMKSQINASEKDPMVKSPKRLTSPQKRRALSRFPKKAIQLPLTRCEMNTNYLHSVITKTLLKSWTSVKLKRKCSSSQSSALGILFIASSSKIKSCLKKWPVRFLNSSSKLLCFYKV